MDVPGRNTAPVEGIDGPATAPKDKPSAQAVASHNPGPWAFSTTQWNNPDHDDKAGSIVNGDGWIVAEVCGDLPADQVKANAALLSAAPDLLHFARWAENVCEDSSLTYAQVRQFIRERASEVIKATGLLLALFVLFAAPSLHAADVAKPAAIYLSLSAADLASTHYALRNGAVEGNGFMARNPYAKQAVMAGAFLGADVLLQSKGKKREAKAMRITYAVVRLVAVGINVRNARKGAR